MDIKESARILTTITEKQWEAILTTSEHFATLPFVKQHLKVDTGCENKAGINKNEDELRLKVVNLVKSIGVPPNILGYKYIQEAIMLVYKDQTYIHNIVKQLYPKIAEIYDTKCSRVERAIRHALEVAYSKGDPKVLKDVFELKDSKPTNSHAIAALVEYLKYD